MPAAGWNPRTETCPWKTRKCTMPAPITFSLDSMPRIANRFDGVTATLSPVAQKASMSACIAALGSMLLYLFLERYVLIRHQSYHILYVLYRSVNYEKNLKNMCINYHFNKNKSAHIDIIFRNAKRVSYKCIEV